MENRTVQQLLDYTWAAANLEAEGCITIGKSVRGGRPYYQLLLCLDNSDKGMIERFHRLFPFGSILIPRKLPNRKQMYRYNVTGKKAVMVLQTLLPYMSYKLTQAGLAITFQHQWDSRVGNAYEKVLFEHCHGLMKQLKKGDVAECGTLYITKTDNEVFV